MQTTIEMVRALATGQLAAHQERQRRLTERAVQLRAELNHTLRMLAAETGEVERFSSILKSCEVES